MTIKLAYGSMFLLYKNKDNKMENFKTSQKKLETNRNYYHRNSKKINRKIWERRKRYIALGKLHEKFCNPISPTEKI